MPPQATARGSFEGTVPKREEVRLDVNNSYRFRASPERYADSSVSSFLVSSLRTAVTRSAWFLEIVSL